MTLVLGLRSAGGVVLAADSQRTEGRFRQEVPKLFIAPAGIIWGTAGTIAIQQELLALLRDLDVPKGLPRQDVRSAIVRALREAVRRATAAMEDPSAVATYVDGVFGWYSVNDRRDYLLHAAGTGHAESHPDYTAVGATPKELCWAFPPRAGRNVRQRVLRIPVGLAANLRGGRPRHRSGQPSHGRPQGRQALAAIRVRAHQHGVAGWRVWLPAEHRPDRTRVVPGDGVRGGSPGQRRGARGPFPAYRSSFVVLEPRPPPRESQSYACPITRARRRPAPLGGVRCRKRQQDVAPLRACLPVVPRRCKPL
jgi:hypothetical protein